MFGSTSLSVWLMPLTKFKTFQPNPTTKYSIQFDELWMFAYDIVFVWMFFNVNDSTTNWWKTQASQEKQLIVHHLMYCWWLLAKPSVGCEHKRIQWCVNTRRVIFFTVQNGEYPRPSTKYHISFNGHPLFGACFWGLVTLSYVRSS